MFPFNCPTNGVLSRSSIIDSTIITYRLSLDLLSRCMSLASLTEDEVFRKTTQIIQKDVLLEISECELSMPPCKQYDQCNVFTRITQLSVFYLLLDTIQPHIKRQVRKTILTSADKRLMVLMRLRLGLLLTDLAYRLQCQRQ